MPAEPAKLDEPLTDRSKRHGRRRWLLAAAAVFLVGLCCICIFFKDARGDVRECEVHKVRLKCGLVRIGYGYPIESNEYRAIEQRYFPHHQQVHHGGCVSGWARWALVRFCPECRQAMTKEPMKKIEATGYGSSLHDQTVTLKQPGKVAGDVQALFARLCTLHPVEFDKVLAELCQREADWIPILLRQMESGDQGAAGQAGRALYLLISPAYRTAERSRRHCGQTTLYSAEYPMGRPLNHPQAAAIREVCLKLARADYSSGERKAANSWTMPLAAEVADDAAAREMAIWLEKESDYHALPGISEAIETIYGLPPQVRLPIHDSLWRVMNQDAAEKQSREVCEQGRKQLLSWLKANADRPGPDRLAAALDVWQPVMTRGARGLFDSYSRPFMETLPLVRQGEPLVPIIDERKAKAANLAVKGRLESIRAGITGKEDRALVAGLLAGSSEERRAGMEIIIAARSKAWIKELAAILDDDIRDSNLADAAVLTLAICHREEALPVLRTAAGRRRDSRMTLCLVKEIELRSPHPESPEGGK